MAEVNKEYLREKAKAAISPDSPWNVLVFEHECTPGVVLSLLDENAAQAARIAELERDKVRLESEAMYGAAGFQAARERIVELEKEGASLLETFVIIADHLGIDCKAAQKLPGKPSQVFIEAIKAREEAARAELERECERLQKQIRKDPYYEISTMAKEVSGLKQKLDRCRAEMKDVRGLVKERGETIDQLRAELEACRKDAERLRGKLLEAAGCIGEWGAYASEYFQEKHNLAGDIAEFQAAAMQEGGV